MTSVGQSVNRVDAVSKVLGESRYPGDIDLPGQAHMKILFANRPHARVLRIDTARTDGPFVAMLKACGLPAHDTVTSMWLGRPRPVDPEMQIFGLANQALG